MSTYQPRLTPETNTALDLLQGVQTFHELEARIAALPDERQRGQAFECFAQACLAVMPTVAAGEVWNHDQVPESVRARFNGALDRDQGIDGVVRTTSDGLHAYQVKFRTGRTPLTWRELSTFVGLTDGFDGRLVFTNCDQVASVVKRRRGLYAITGADLDQLSVEDLRRIGAWLEGRRVSASPPSPLPHQEEALSAITTELAAKDRATAVLACGTGKTLIGAWATQRLGARTVLVLVPSLALVRQTLHAWALVWPRDSLIWQCVCSDATVDQGRDEWMLRQEDLDFPVTTQSTEVRRFLDFEFAGTKVLFATYHSAPVVAQAVAAGDQFDLGIFDEAHRTAGRAGLKFSFALDDQNLRIAKRLFLTATPRHYDVRKRTSGGEFATVYSMDNPDAYGRVAHHLGLARAAEQGIICPYKVIISVVTEAELMSERLRIGESILNGDSTNALDLANRIALAKAIDHYGVRKVFTFHRSIAAARAFASTQSPGIGRILRSFDLFHIHGAMPVARRHRLLDEFNRSSEALMSNARCLTEGVNVPEVDMVALLTPKRSRVDIVQAVGRCLRKADYKSCGYVFLPVLLGPGETVETAVRRTDFTHVWEVLQALLEQDAVLAECIRQLTEDKGRARPLNTAAFAERVEILGPPVGIERLRRAVTFTCVDALGGTWDERYGQLLAFKEGRGHCRVPLDWKENPELAGWVSKQRTDRRQGSLRPDREGRLRLIGFDWEPDASAWQERFDELVAYREEHGHCNVPHTWQENRRLGHWVAIQRRRHAQKKLPLERQQKLEALGFAWSPLEAFWEERFQQLRAFAAEHGHADVPQKSSKHPHLGSWLNTLRALKLKRKLPPEKIRRLETLGVRWEPLKEDWERMFEALVAFKTKHGHCLVPDKSAEHLALSVWVASLRRQLKTGRLTTERQERLQALGFVWDAREAVWDAMLASLRTFVAEHGHASVPREAAGLGELAQWLQRQRQLHRRGKLSPERAKQLESLGVVWEPHDVHWHERFEALRQLKESGAPWNPPRDARLAKWLKHQTHFLANRALKPDRARKMRGLLCNGTRP